MTRPSAAAWNRRNHLLGRSALAGLGVAVMIGATPALAQVTGVGTVTSTGSNGGAVGVASGGGVTDITLGASRSIVDWSTLNVTSTDTLNFHFGARGDIVLNRVAGSASVDGILNGCMATCGDKGGNVWILSAGGVLIGANARINTGGFLASTGALTDPDFLDGDMNFAFTGALTNSTISVANGAQITTHGGTLALIAPIVTTAAGSIMTGTNGGDVVYGSAENYNVTFAPTGADDLDLITFQVPAQTDGSAGTPGLTLNGTTNANQVFAAVVSKASVASSILLGGNITATTASGENGDIVLSAGSGFTNGVADTPMGFDGSITQNTTSTLTAANVTLRASDNIAVDEINATGRVWLNSEWASISQTGAITANILRAEAGGDVILTNTGNDFNFLTYIEAQGLNGIDIVDADGFVINDYIFHLGGGTRTASLTALTGSISQTGGAIQVGTLNVSAAGGSIDLGTAANNTANLGTITAGAGDFSYRSLLDVNLAGAITANNVTLSSLSGAITQSNGSINTNQLSARADTGINLNRVGNQIAEITGLSSTSGDIILISNGNLSLAGNVTGSAVVSLQTLSGGITQNSGIITAGSFSANAGGGLSLGGENLVTQLGNLTAGGTGDIVFRNAGALSLTGAITAAGDDVTLYSTSGAITQASGGITADRLTASATGDITLNDGVNNVATIGGLASATGDIVYRDVDDFDLQGDITANSTPFRGVMLAVSGAGAVTQTSGVINVGYFRGVTSGSITLGGANQIRRLISTVVGSGVLTLNTTTDLSVDGSVSASGVSLSSTGAITQAANAQIWTSALNASAVTGINLTATGFGVNNIAALGLISNTTSGGVTIGNAYPTMNLAGSIVAAGQAVSISNTLGGINQTGGIILADTVSLAATGAINLGSNNAVSKLGAVTAGGAFTFVNAGALNLTDSIAAGGYTVSLTTNAGAINQNAGTITADWIKLNASTTISQAVGASLTSTSLSLTSGGNVSLGQANSFVTLQDLAVAGDMTLRNLGTIDMNPVLTGGYSSGGALILISDTGSIRTTGVGIATSRLTASAAGSIDLNGTIASLGDVTAGANILLTTYNGAMALTGDVTGRTVSLYANTGVTQSAGKIDAERLNVVTNGAISLTGANEIDVVGRLETDQASSGTGANITLRNVGSIVLDYLVGAAGANVSLTSDTGGISQTGFSVITANQITATAGAGDITLDQNANSIAAIGGLSTTGGDISLSTTTGLSLSGSITAVGGDVSLRAGGGHLLQSAGAITADKLSLSATGSISLGQNFVSKLGRISAGGDFVTDSAGMSSGVLELTDDITAAGMVVLHNPGGINQTGGGIQTTNLVLNAWSGNLTASGANRATGLAELIGNNVTYNDTGNLALRVTADGSASITAGGSLSFSGFGASSAGGVLNLDAATGISQVQALSAGSFGTIINRTSGGVALTNVNGAINLAGNVTAAGQTVSLRSNNGQIEQTGGVITANVLNLQAAGRIWVNNANAVTNLGRVIAGGHVLFRNDGNTVVGDDITANGFDVTLRSNNGSITQTAGSDITSNSLQLIAQTGISLTNAGNAVGELSWAQTASGGFAFGQTNGFLIGGPVMAGGQTVSLTSLNGAITQNSGGAISAGTLNASAAGTLTLNQGNNVDSLGVINTGGSFLFRDVNGFNLTGNVTAASQVVMLAQNGSITQTGGIITAADINAMASGDLSLGGANQINAISALSAGSNLLYRQVGDLSVPTISAPGTISLYSTTGDITQTGTITAAALVLGAGGDITLGQNFVSRLGRIDAGGNFTASDAGGLSSGVLQLTDDITVGGAMTLVNPGAITQTGGAITAASLFIDTDGALTAAGANAVSGNTRLSALDATFNAVGNLTVQVNTTGFASITSTGAVVIDGVGASTGDTLNIQAANGISKGVQDLNFTKFGTLTNTTAGGINLTNSNWVELNGVITAAGQTVTLNVANGGIIQNAGNIITARRLSVTTTQGAIMNEMNQVAELGVIDVGAHNFSFRTLGDLLVDGDITSALNVSLTSATGNVSQTAGSDIKAGGLTVWAETGINLTNVGNDVDKLLTVINLGSGGIAYAQTDGFQIDSVVRALNQTVSLTSLAGGISETGTVFAQIEARTLNLSAGGAITLHRDNDVDNLGVVSAGGGFTFNDVDGFNLTGNVNAGAVVLDAVAGSITQSGGVITASSIDAAASGNLDLGSANVVGAVTALSAGGDILYRQVGNLSVPTISATGSLSLYSTTGSISQTGALSAATLNLGAVTGILLNNSGNDIGALRTVSNTTSGQINFLNGDGFDLTGAITAGGSQFVNLNALSGAITQQAGGSITAQVLSLSAWSGATLGGDNNVDALGVIIAGPSFIFNDIDGFDISGVLNAQTADLTAVGAITQSAGNLNVGTLSLKATSATLNGANDIDNLRDVDVAGNFTLRDIDGIDLTGAIVVDGTLKLTSDSEGVTQLAGSTIDVGRLEASAYWSVILSQAGNAIDALGDITATTGNISIAAGGPISIDGDLSAAASGQFIAVRSVNGGVAMTTAGSITAGGNVTLRGEGGGVVLGDINAGATLSVVAMSGSITSTAAPTIVADRLTAYATQDVVLTGSNLDIDQFGLIVGNDVVSIAGNNGPLDLNGNVTGRTVTLGSTGAITQSGGVISADTANISSSAGSLTLGLANAVGTVSLNGASVSYTSSGSFAANVVTATGAVSLTSNTGKITQTALTGRIVAGSLTASAATGLEFFGGQNDITTLAGLSSTSGGVTYRDMGGFDITGNISAAGQQVELVSDGTGSDGNDITQSGGVITAARLTGTSAGDFLLTRANVVGRIDALNAGTALAYRGAGNVELWGNLTAGTALDLVSDTASILQFGGAISAQTLTASAATGIQLARVNDIDSLGAITVTAGGFTFRDADSFNITGAVQASDVSLQAGADIIQTTGGVTTGALSVFANGLVDLDGPGNDIASLAAGFAGTDFRFADATDFTLDGNVVAGGVMTLSAGAGNINQNAGILTAATLNASAAGELNLTKANAVTTLGNLSAGDRIYFASADSFSIAGNLTSDLIILASADGGVTQTGGAITAGALAVDAKLDVTLGQAGNDVDTLSYVTVRNGDFAYRDADSVSLSGPVSMSGVATFNVGGDLIQTAAGVISARKVQGSAVGAFSLGDAANAVSELGPITAAGIAFTADGALTLVGALASSARVELKAVTGITQSAGAVITGTTLRAQANGDIILDQANDLDSITLLNSQFGNITYVDSDGFSLDPTVYGDIWTTGTLTLTAGATGAISQTNAGLRAGTLIVSAGQNVVLDQQNVIGRLGASSAGGSAFTVVNDGDLEIVGDISVAGPLGAVSLTSTNGAVDQTAGEIDAYVVKGSAAGDFTLTRFTGAVGDIASTAGDIDIGNTGDINLFGLLKTSSANSVTLASSGGGVFHGVGRIEAGTLNLSAATAINLDGAQGNDIDRLGVVSAGSNFAFTDDNDFDLTGDVDVTGIGGQAGLRSNGGAITQSGGRIAAYNLNLEAVTGLNLTGANLVDRVTITNGATGAVAFSNAKALSALGVSSAGDVTLTTTAGLLTSTDVMTGGRISLAGAGGVLSTGTLSTDGDVVVSSSGGDIDVRNIVAGDDVTVTADAGQAQVWNLVLTGFSDGEGTGQNVSISASGDAILGARGEAGIGLYPSDLVRSGGAGTVSVVSSGGDARVFLSSIGDKIDTLTAGGATGTAVIVANSGDILAGAVTGYNVVLKAYAGDVDPDAVVIGGGDYTLVGRDFASGAFDFTGAARDVFISDTAGDLTLSGNIVALRNLTINAVGGVLGSAGLVAGADLAGQGDLSIVATSISASAIGADGDVTLNAGNGHIAVGTLVVADDYSLSGGSFSNGALSPIGAMAGTWTITDASGFNFTGLTLTYNGDIKINAGDAIVGGSVQSIRGSVEIATLSDIDVEGLYAAHDITVDSGGALTIDSATAYGGGVNLTGAAVTVEGFAEASGNVLVTASNGGADVGAATAGGDIVVTATNGGARLGAANLTGLTGDLTISSTGGNATLGAINDSSISTDNLLTRAAGGTGTVTVTASNGDALVYLDNATATLDVLQGDNVDVLIATGGATIGTLTALNGDVYAETLSGALTIGSADATHGGVGLYATGGDLTLTGAVFGASEVVVQTDGLLDGSLATSISSGGNLRLIGGSVKLDSIAADGNIMVGATTGDAYVAFATAGQTVQVVSIAGNATLRGAEGPDGIAVVADRTATFGADSKALIGALNYGVSGLGGCGCGLGGITVLSFNGDAVVNLQRVTGVFDMIRAGGATGNANVVLGSGNLTISDLAGYNIGVEVVNGSIETGHGDPTTYGVFSGGGNYSLKAQDFLGNVLRPTVTGGSLNSFTLVDTLGGLDMTGVSVTARGDILIDARGGGALTGDAQLTAVGGVTVMAAAIQAAVIEAGGDVSLYAEAGTVDIATRVTVGGNYNLHGEDFTTAALSPLGARAGVFEITDTLGDLDYSAATLRYGGKINISSTGRVVGGDVTSDNGDILIQGQSIDAGALSAGNGKVDAYGYGAGGVRATSATAKDSIYIYASTGDAVLGAATLLGTGVNTLNIHVDAGTGNAVFGAASAGGVTAAYAFTSAGSSTTASVSSGGGDAFVHLDRSDALTSVFAAQNVGIAVRNGDFAVGSIYAVAGRVDVEGPSGRLAIGRLAAGSDARILGTDLSLAAGTIAGDLIIDVDGDVAFADTAGVSAGRTQAGGEISLTAGGGVSQAGGAGLAGTGLTLSAGDGVSLLGANDIAVLRNIDVAAGGFAYRSVRVGGVSIVGTLNAVGQTVDLRVENGGLGQPGAGLIIAGRLTGSSDGGVNLHANNRIAELGAFANGGGDFFLNVDQALSIVGLVDSTETVTIQSHAMTVASTGTVRSSASGDAIKLASNGVFTNQSGADAVQASNGRWLIYTQAFNDPSGSTAGDDFGGLGGKSYYGTSYDFDGNFGAAINAGNRFVHAYRPILTVTPVSRTVTYNGQIPTLTAAILGLINGDSAADAWSGSPLLSGNTSKNVGSYSLSAALGSLLSDLNYDFAFGTGTLVIDPKTIIGTVNANNKTYDGTTVATGTITLTGVVTGDDVAAAATSYGFADKNAGTGKTVTASGASLSGADAGNYTLDPVAAALADISRKAITGTLAALGKTYDGTTATTGSVTLTGVIAGDTVSAAGGTFAFADKNAGVGKTVTATGVGLGGGDAGNYDLTAVAAGVADIARKAIGGTLTASNKTYDGTTAASGSISLTGVVAGDSVAAGGVYAFADANAGTGKSVSVSGITLTGTDSGNYVLSGTPSSALADILRRQISIRADDKNKLAGQLDPAFTWRITASSLVGGDGLTGGLARASGEMIGDYAIGQGSLTAGANYEILFAPGVFNIRPVPTAGQDGGDAFRHLRDPKGYGLQWNPTENFTYSQEPVCLSASSCPAS